MDILKFRVRGQALTLINPNVNLIPVTDTVNQYLCQFEFSEDWYDLNKVVVFKNVSYNILKEVYLSTSNECYIPWEVLSNSGEIFLEVIGTEVRGDVVTVRIPSTLLGFKWEIQEGLLDVSANVSPTPDLFEQFVSSVRSDSIVAATARDEAVIARDVAVQSAADASASELAATSAAESAVNSASTASSAASSASESALSVAGVADETKSYAEIASAKAADASTQAEIAAGAKEDAVTAKNGAEAARNEAATSADLAQTTESHIKTMTVSAHSLAETEAPTVTKTDTSTGFALDFGIPKGATGPKGEDGDNIHYTWVKYADTPTSGMSDDPTGKAYIGIAYNKSTPVGSTVYSDYAWSRIKGEAGEDGYSPTVTTGTSGDGSTTLTVTNKDGSTTTELADGKARADIANLEIGGRNLLLNSKFKDNADGWKYPSYISEYVVKDGRKCAHVEHSVLKTDKSVQQSIFGKLEPNTQYIMSGWVLTENVVKGTTNFVCAFYQSGYYDNNGTTTWYSYGQKDIPINAGKWTRLEWAFTTDSVKTLNAITSLLFIYTRDMTGDVYFCDLKLEKGNKATDWTPAPEDNISLYRNIGNINKWNQLVKNGNFEDSRGWGMYSTPLGEYTVSNNIAKITYNGTLSDTNFFRQALTLWKFPYLTIGHKVYFSAKVRPSVSCLVVSELNGAQQKMRAIQCPANTWTDLSAVTEIFKNLNETLLFYPLVSMANGATFEVKEVFVTDLTEAFGVGNEPTTVQQFKTFFPDNYYPYIKGTREVKELLWTNASPDSSFAAQNISLNLSGYDNIVLVYKMSASNTIQYFEEQCLLGKRLTAIALYSETSFVYRFFDSSESGIQVSAPAGATTDASYLIPYKIYGIKEV